MNKSLKIVFMGTPEFAVASLDALLKSRHRVVGVITVPDKPASRGLKLQSSEVKEYALRHNLKILQPDKLKNESFLAELKALNADLQVVVAFRMLPEVVWSMPRLGTINLHASLLPQYRGAAPINWAIINGEKETGITTFLLSHEIDTGDILMKHAIAISDYDDAGTIHDKLMIEGAELLVKTVDSIADGTIKAVKQEHVADIKLAPKIFRESCRIDWNRPVRDVFNLIRGLSPYPGAWTELLGEGEQKMVFKIFKTMVNTNVSVPMGKVTSKDSQLYIGCKDAAIEVLELQPEGKKRMPAADFLRGIQSGSKTWDAVY